MPCPSLRKALQRHDHRGGKTKDNDHLIAARQEIRYIYNVMYRYTPKILYV